MPRPDARQRALIAAVAVVAVLAGLFGWSGYRLYQDRATEQSRELLVETGKRAAAELTTIDYQHAETDVRRVLDSATGGFRDEFAGRSEALIDVVRKAQSTSVGTVTEAGLESMSGDGGRVLVTVAVRTKNFGVPEQQPRYWRMRLTLVTADGRAKVSKVEFV